MIKQWVHANSQQFWRIWLIILGVGMTLAGLSAFFIDQSFAQFFSAPERVNIWLFHRNITEIGSAEPYIAIALLALFKKSWRKKAGYFLACMASGGAFLHIVKISVGRMRPHKSPEHDPFWFEPFNTHHHWQSFPSGHSQTLLTVAVFIAYLFPKTTPWVLLAGVYFSFTRAFTMAHFVSDVVGGMIVGLLFTTLTLRILNQKYGT